MNLKTTNNQQQVEMMGKVIRVELSDKAKKQLHDRETPLFVEMELYFSCLLRKKFASMKQYVNWWMRRSQRNFSENLHISFRPVMTKSCSVSSCEGEAPSVSDFPIEKPQSYVPKWMRLDFKKG